MKFFAGGIILQLAKLVGCLQLCGTVGFRWRGEGAREGLGLLVI